MNKLLIIFGLLFSTLQGYGDTLAHWHVYLNDSVIGEFTVASQDITIELDSRSLTKTDSISIRHTPCNRMSNCTYHWLIRSEYYAIIKEIESKIPWMTVAVKDLIERDEKVKTYYFQYYVEFRLSMSPQTSAKRQILKLKII